MVGGLPPAPRWAWVVMALSVVAIAVMSYLVVNRPPPPGFPAPAAAEGSAEPAATEEVRLLVVGDGVTASGPEGGPDWPQLVADGISADGPPVTVTVAAAGGTGYLQTPPGGPAFGRLAEEAGGDFDVVVFFGSRADTAVAADVQAAAEAAFSAAREASPDAGLVVIGPAWPSSDVPGYIETNRDAVSAAAATAGASFIDPLLEGWLTDPGLIGPDQLGPTPEGERYLADRIGPLVQQVLPQGR